jgi:hypothetical protein
MTAACGAGHQEIAELLLAKGADINWLGRGDKTLTMTVSFVFILMQQRRSSLLVAVIRPAPG